MRGSCSKDVHLSSDHMLFFNAALPLSCDRFAICFPIVFRLRQFRILFQLSKMCGLTSEDRCEILLSLQQGVSPTLLKDKYGTNLGRIDSITTFAFEQIVAQFPC